MKILLIDLCGAALDWAMQCIEVGHEVKMWCGPRKDGARCDVGDGIIQRVPRWEPHMNWADLIFLTDNAKEIEKLEPYRKKGYPIFGPGVEAAKLELDRDAGQQAFKKAGIDIMESIEFNDYDKAIEYVKKNMKRYVSKPSGDADKALSYVSKSPADMIFMLQRWKEMGKNKSPFILQEFNPGIEMAVGGWFGPGGWSKWFCENFEHKKLMAGDNGVNTGEMGTCLKYVEYSKLADEMLLPLTGMLKKMNYVGYVDVAVIIDKEGKPWPLEFTTRPGWPCFIIQTALHLGDPAQWMLDLINGKDTLEVLGGEVATGVVMAIPDFPYGNKKKEEVSGFPIYGVEGFLHTDIHLCEVKMGKAPIEKDGKIMDGRMFVTAGDYVLVATGTDYSVSGSSKRAYRALKKAEVPNSPMWRIDIGKRLEKHIEEIQEHGYADDWSYD